MTHCIYIVGGHAIDSVVERGAAGDIEMGIHSEERPVGAADIADDALQPTKL
jgi:hypothetical protein